MLACDHSTGGVIIGGALKKAGFGGGIVRYACAGRGDVNITPAEARDLTANGIPIGIVLEHQADWLLGDAATVRARVNGCRDITRACAIPDGVTFMAADWDCTNGGPVVAGGLGERNLRGILASLTVAGDVIGRENVGFYGSAFGIDWLVKHAPWVKWFWCTEAWSHGWVHPAAQLFQRAASANVAGVSIDVDVILKPAWGQRGSHTPPPPPKPVAHGPSGHFTYAGAFDAGNGHWETHGTPSKDAVFGTGPHDKWARVEHAICIEGPSKGQHRLTPLPWGR